ncbi:hypothetical protein RSOLAG22IIIB_08754 [Rhizoctonia solani]|uniref:Peroxisomal trans-2-enoyl-CoA reductase n=1 Tax=Rhizoctonia solani TaxID=456999 RepID=A0A0K6FUL1_9AGAM|nr:hypothetical protein RSOLAG22IIIB_08754 [Rhizoctonia solani]
MRVAIVTGAAQGIGRAIALRLAADGLAVGSSRLGNRSYRKLGTASTGQAFIQKMIQQVPLKRMGQPEEVAALVSFIASPGVAYITGQTLSVDGGQIMS